ncbi:MAG: histidinol-phosphate transaminase, partial [Gammaproteobacteria bacterium RIFCSPHIGHO2_02_FULL_38_33]
SQYTFATIPLILKSFGANIVTIPTQAWQVDCKAILNTLHAKVKMIFIVNPNNPTGTYVSKSNLELILEKASPETIIVVDEAYNEYIDAEDYTDALPYIEQYPNLIVVRTFSKAYGLSGLRVGYAISQAQVADILNRTRLPFNVNSIALAAATASLNDQAHVEKSKALNDRGKKKLTEGFKKLNLNFIPSVANFVTVHVGEKALDIYEKLLQKGVIVRPLVGYGMGEFLRITIGTEKENARLLSALGEVK